MTQILVRNLDPAVVDRLKHRAASNHRSLQAEVKALLEEAAQVDPGRAREIADGIRSRLHGRTHGDSADLIRELRDA
jgi:hypothetical protein